MGKIKAAIENLKNNVVLIGIVLTLFCIVFTICISLFAPQTIHGKLLIITIVLLIVIVPFVLIWLWIKKSNTEIKYFHVKRIISELEYQASYEFSKNFFTEKRHRIDPDYEFPDYKDTKEWWVLGNKHLYAFKDKTNKHYWGHFELVPLKKDAVTSIIQGKITEETELKKKHIDTSKKANNFYIGDLIRDNPIKNKDCSGLRPELGDYAVNRLIITAFRTVIKENKLDRDICIIAFAETSMGRMQLEKYHFTMSAQNKDVYYKSYSIKEIADAIKDLENATSQIKDKLETALADYYGG